MGHSETAEKEFCFYPRCRTFQDGSVSYANSAVVSRQLKCSRAFLHFFVWPHFSETDRKAWSGGNNRSFPPFFFCLNKNIRGENRRFAPWLQNCLSPLFFAPCPCHDFAKRFFQSRKFGKKKLFSSEAYRYCMTLPPTISRKKGSWMKKKWNNT